jgi:hypothetical protein
MSNGRHLTPINLTPMGWVRGALKAQGEVFTIIAFYV